MSSGRKDPKDDDKLLTSEDLFGDMLDEKPAAPKPEPGSDPAARRSGPIKVQVSEPVAPAPPAPTPTPSPSGRITLPKGPLPKSPLGGPAAGELPDDVAALLDAFSAPGEAAASPPAAPERPAAPPKKPEPAAAPSPPPVSLATDDEAMKDLRSLRGQMKPALPADVPAPKSRTGTRFRAAAPQAPASPGKTLDLAALADEALGQAPARARPEPPPAPTPVVSAAPPAPEETPPHAAEPARPGEGTYGPYRLLERVAVGGMAEVFKAKRSGVEGFEKVVAVKRILPHLTDNKEFVDMFVDEAKMVAGLTHPNIVQIFDLGRIEKSYYIAMEYVQGRDLRSILRRARERGTRAPLELCALIASRACSALEYAHRKKDDRGQPMMTVHRDISPQNILISFEGDVKLTDFGIAKAASKATVTEAGALRGKLLYMSPQLRSVHPRDRARVQGGPAPQPERRDPARAGAGGDEGPRARSRAPLPGRGRDVPRPRGRDARDPAGAHRRRAGPLHGDALRSARAGGHGGGRGPRARRGAAAGRGGSPPTAVAGDDGPEREHVHPEAPEAVRHQVGDHSACRSRRTRRSSTGRPWR